MKLSKGANAPVPTSLLAVVISWQSEHAVDAHALLLTEAGAVRTDRDLVFFNAPRHISQAVTLDQEPAPRTARLSVSLPRTEADVHRIIVAGSVEDGTFGDIAGLTLTIEAAHGPIAQFDISDSDSVAAMMFGEFYRREGQWRFRAIGQGWSSGLVGLITEFGVTVEDPAARVPAHEPTDPFDRSRPRSSTIPAPQHVPTGSVGSERVERQLAPTEARGDDNLQRSTGVDQTRRHINPTGPRNRKGSSAHPQSTAPTSANQTRGHVDPTEPQDQNDPATRPQASAPIGTNQTRRHIHPTEPQDQNHSATRPQSTDVDAERADRHIQRPADDNSNDQSETWGPADGSQDRWYAGPTESRDNNLPTPSQRTTQADRQMETEPWRQNDALSRAQPSRPVDLDRRRPSADPVPPQPPPDPERADWHSDPEDPSRMRWWDGTEWTSATHVPRQRNVHDCARCGNPRRRKLFGRIAPCQICDSEIEEFLTHWHTQAWRVLTTSGPRGADWAALWASLRYQRIDEGLGREALRDVALSYVERLVTFAFADGEIEHPEFEAFEYAIDELALTGPLVEDLRRRMHRGRMLSRLRAGDLPVVRTPGLHLDPEEKVHLDLPAVHIRRLARGPKLTEGRLIASNKKLRFVGVDTGTELPWNRVVSVHVEQRTVVIAATSARGGAIFDIADPDYVAAALEGALRVAKRLILTPGQRDTRSIPQEVKAEVWQRDGGKCIECGDSHYLEFDHIIPLSRGGATSATNLQILCRACNRAKGARI